MAQEHRKIDPVAEALGDAIHQRVYALSAEKKIDIKYYQDLAYPIFATAQREAINANQKDKIDEIIIRVINQNKERLNEQYARYAARAKEREEEEKRKEKERKNKLEKEVEELRKRNATLEEQRRASWKPKALQVLNSSDPSTQAIINKMKNATIEKLSNIRPAPGKTGVVQVSFEHGPGWSQKPYYYIDVATKEVKSQSYTPPETMNADIQRLKNALSNVGGRRKTRKLKKSRRRHTRRH